MRYALPAIVPAPAPTVVADRATFDHAAELIAAFGANAGIEAALRAGRSRDRGNVLHFCRWRQVERLLDAITSQKVAGTLH